MTKNHIIKLKNGETFTINSDQYVAISKALAGDKVPQFIEIQGNVIKTDYIAYIKEESW
jgi:hypothetical protein